MLQRLRSRHWLRYWCNQYVPHLSAMLAAAVLFTLLLTARHLGWLQAAELSTFDYLLRQQIPVPPRPELLVVGVSEADIQALRQFPLKDALLARVLRNLRKHGAALVGLDIYRDFPQEPGHAELIEELRTGEVIVISKLGTSAMPGIAAPPGVPPERVGFSDLVLDADGVVRRGLLYVEKTPNNPNVSFAMQLAQHYMRQQGVTPRNLAHAPASFGFGASVISPLGADSGGYQNISAGGFQVLLNYRRHSNPAEIVSFRDVLEERVVADKIRGRIVLIGVTASSIKDTHFTPFSHTAKVEVQTPGVVIHAHILGQILDAVDKAPTGFRFWPEWAELLWLLGWGALAALLAWQLHHLWLFQIAMSGGLALLLTSDWLLFQNGVWVPVWEAVLAFIVGGLSILAGRMAYLALYDPLTGLPNRVNLVQRLHRLLKPSPHQSVALILVELNRHKLINAVFGPHAGDAFLVEMAKRLRGVANEYGILCLRSWSNGDIVPARAGGAELALLVIKTVDRDDVLTLAHALQQRCIEPFSLGGEEIFLTATAGIALGAPDYHGNLLRDAHAAMSHANALGNPLEIFDGEVKAEEIKAFQVERELHAAVRKSRGDLPHLPEFPVYYQPLVDLRTGRISGFEALVRWQHPRRGFVPPGKFVSVAESSGTIVPIGNWVLLEACRRMRAWRADFPELLISVNLAAPQLTDPGTFDYLKRVLAETGLPPTALKLEMTESTAIRHLDTAVNMLDACRSLGIKVAIDDFGTGYSSLAYLTKFPVDILKIDMTFVHNMDASANDFSILRTITGLAQDLNLVVIAEGVETSRHLEILRQLACDYGQGYLFGKPQSASETEALLRAGPVW